VELPQANLLLAPALFCSQTELLPGCMLFTVSIRKRRGRNRKLFAKRAFLTTWLKNLCHLQAKKRVQGASGLERPI
ncbi:hypothetical protein NE624_18460, partial [Alistipes onderdonkii]|nr:hypothetical protein [Alistipes onderdonkii]